MRKKRVGIITYHAAHNYGSNLQAYALQKTIVKIGCECEIINFRTKRQIDQYTPLTKRKGIKYILKNIYFLLNYKSRKRKYDRFEQFISDRLVMTLEEYSSLAELEKREPQFDYYISGSDQIWNTVPNDADDAYFLPFVKTGKKIAYAPSFGQIGTLERQKNITAYLKKYDVISVREEHAQKLVVQMTGKVPPIMPDPTLLFPREEWEKMIPDSVVEGDYLFFYTLYATSEMISWVKYVSRKQNLPVVISNISNQHEIFSGFKKKKDTGPLEFLSLIKNAKFACVTSFHGTVFSILLQKPFCVLRGMEDKRIATLLEIFELQECSITMENIDQGIEYANHIDWERVEDKLDIIRKKGIGFLKEALEVDV